MEEKLLCILLWYKLYPAFWFLGMLVGLDGSNAYRLVNRLRPLLKKAADSSLGVYLKKVTREIKKGRKKISSWEDLKREFPEIAEIFIDVTEQQRKRPKKQVQIVEHVISWLKKYAFLTDVFRGKVKQYNQDFQNIAALVNFRLNFRLTVII